VGYLSPFSYIIKHIKTYKSIPFLFEMAENRTLEKGLSENLTNHLKGLAVALIQAPVAFGAAYWSVRYVVANVVTESLVNLTYSLVTGGQ
jgi:hypothetical protein